ncbi:MAG: hypothetical protein ACPG45_00885 [Flavobacteriaceae bacterium]
MKKIVLSLITVIALMSCEDNKTNIPTTENYNPQELSKSEEANKIAEEVNSIITKDYEEDGANKNTTNNNQTYLPDCVTRTYTSDGTNHSVEFDFGTTACVMPNGNAITGKILYTYVGDILADTKTITYTLIDFTFNNLDVQGSDVIDHIRSNTNGNPQSTIHVDFTITWPDGMVGERTGTILREWIEGSDTLLDWTDDVFLVSGNWSTTFDNGNTYSATININLRRELTCWYFVSGTIDFNYNELIFTGDYGDNTCDNDATLIFPNGTIVEIEL